MLTDVFESCSGPKENQERIEDKEEALELDKLYLGIKENISKSISCEKIKT